MELTPAGLGWQPANDLERSLRDAVYRGDTDHYRTVVGSATMLLALPPESSIPTEGPTPWPVAEFDGRTYVMAFTSVEAMRAATGSTAARRVLFPDLAHVWPDPSVWLAVNLATPIQALMDAGAVARVASTAERMASPVDAALRAAIRSGHEAAYALALLAADLVIPISPQGRPGARLGEADFGWWRAETTDGHPVIVAFTSRQRLQATLDDVDCVVVDAVDVLSAWPDRQVSLAVNPASPIAALISGAAVAGLADWATKATGVAQQAARAVLENPLISESERDAAAYAAAREAVARLLRTTD